MNPSRLASRATHSTPEFQAFPRWPPGSPKFPALWAGQVDFNSSKEPFSWFQHILKALALAWPLPRGALPACFTPHSFCLPAQFLPPRRGLPGHPAAGAPLLLHSGPWSDLPFFLGQHCPGQADSTLPFIRLPRGCLLRAGTMLGSGDRAVSSEQSPIGSSQVCVLCVSEHVRERVLIRRQ